MNKNQTLNTVAVAIFRVCVASLLGFGIYKVDSANDLLITMKVRQAVVLERLEKLDERLKSFVTWSEFNAEVKRIDREMEAIKKKT